MSWDSVSKKWGFAATGRSTTGSILTEQEEADLKSQIEGTYKTPLVVKAASVDLPIYNKTEDMSIEEIGQMSLDTPLNTAMPSPVIPTPSAPIVRGGTGSRSGAEPRPAPKKNLLQKAEDFIKTPAGIASASIVGFLVIRKLLK